MSFPFLHVFVENDMKIASLGGIEVIISAMKRHSGHEEIQHYGCRALNNLALDSGLSSLSCTVYPFSQAELSALRYRSSFYFLYCLGIDA